MGYNGSNRKGYDARYRGFSRSADRFADRLLFGPTGFRRRVVKDIVSSGKNCSDKANNNSSSLKSDDVIPKGSSINATPFKSDYYKCPCGKITIVSDGQHYCPSCGRWLGPNNIVSEDEALKAKHSGCLGVFLLPLLISVGFCLLFL